MSLFQHPHLTRGIVKTAKGAFVVSRGLVDVPDELGESLGWLPADAANDTPTNQIAHGATQRSRDQETQSTTGAQMAAAQRRGARP